MKKNLIIIFIFLIISLSLDIIFKDKISMIYLYKQNLSHNSNKIVFANNSEFINHVNDEYVYNYEDKDKDKNKNIDNDNDKVEKKFKVLLLNNDEETIMFYKDLLNGKYKLNIDKLYIMSLDSDMGFSIKATTTSIVNIDNNFENISFEFDYLKYFDK